MYKRLYYLLFNAITDALAQLKKRNYGEAETLLISAQKAEEGFINGK